MKFRLDNSRGCTTDLPFLTWAPDALCGAILYGISTWRQQTQSTRERLRVKVGGGRGLRPLPH